IRRKKKRRCGSHLCQLRKSKYCSWLVRKIFDKRRTQTRMELATKSTVEMKNSLLLAAFVLLSSTFAVAQSTESEENERPKIVRELDRDDDKLVFEITNDMWLDLPDGVKLRGFSPGFKGYFYSDYTFGQNSNFSFA